VGQKAGIGVGVGVGTLLLLGLGYLGGMVSQKRIGRRLGVQESMPSELHGTNAPSAYGFKEARELPAEQVTEME
jgi:hypothetical protein